MGSGKGKTRRVRASQSSGTGGIQARCSGFPSYLLNTRPASEIILRHVDAAKNMHREYRVSVFLDSRDNSPAVVTAWGRIGESLQYKAERPGQFRRGGAFDCVIVAREANEAITAKEEKGYEVMGGCFWFRFCRFRARAAPSCAFHPRY